MKVHPTRRPFLLAVLCSLPVHLVHAQPLAALAGLLAGGAVAQTGDEPAPDAPPERPPEKALTPKQVEKLILEQQRAAGLAPPEDAPYRPKGGDTPTDQLGSTLPEIRSFEVEEILEDPKVFEGARVKIVGMVRRGSTNGTWVELAEYKSAPMGVRLIPADGTWTFTPSNRDRRVHAYGTLRRHKLDLKAAQALDVEAGEKPKSRARVEWVLDALGAEVQWLQ